MIRIDFAWCAVYRDEVEVPLGPMEFAALVVLASKPGIHSSHELVERCHPREDTRGWPANAVRNWAKKIIQRLRQRLGADAILNKPGFGYALARGELAEESP